MYVECVLGLIFFFFFLFWRVCEEVVLESENSGWTPAILL